MPYLLLLVLLLGSGLGVGLGLAEAPTATGPVPPNPAAVTADWQEGFPIVEPAIAVVGPAAAALASAIDAAPPVQLPRCPTPSAAAGSVTLAFSYPLGPPSRAIHASFTVTVHVAFTGCRWMWTVRPSGSKRWLLTSAVLAALRPLGGDARMTRS